MNLNEVSMLRVLAPAPCLLALIAAPVQQDREVFAMGTRLKVHLQAAQAAAVAEAVLAEVERIEAACSTWRPDSAFSRINAASVRAVPLDREWIQLLVETQEWCRRTQGAFDPVLMALLKAWGVREGGRLPGPDERTAALEASGTAQLELDEAAGTARLRHPQAGLEEGAFLKGYALDAGRRVALAMGVRNGWADFGGQVLVWGIPKRVAIADPVLRGTARASILLTDGSLSTSGCSERGRHILDPRTGTPCEAWGSVSVVAPSGFDADVLSTALYVLGPEAGLAWAEAHHVPALFLPNHGNARMSPRFAALRPTFAHGDN